MKVQLTDCGENNFDNPLFHQFTTNTSKASVLCDYYCQATAYVLPKLPTPPESVLRLQTQFILVTSNNYFKPT